MTLSVQVLQEHLKNALASVSPAIPLRPTLAACSHIRLRTVGGSLAVSATDLDLAITTTAAAKVTEEGEILVPGHEFIRQVDALPNEVITLTVEGAKVVIRCQQAVTRLATIDIENWPALPTLDDLISVSVGAAELRAALNRSLIAVAKDDSRPVLTGVYFTSDADGTLELAAADGFQASAARVKPLLTNATLGPIIVPGSSVKALLAAARGAAADAAITIHGVHRGAEGLSSRFIGFRCGKTDVVSVLVEGQYPNYRKLFPTEFATTVSAPRQALARAVKLASLTDSAVSLRISESEIFVSAETAENTHSNGIGFCEVSGPPLKVRIDSGYLTDLFPQFEGENVLLKFMDENSQIVATDGEGRDYWTVITMPLFQSVEAKRKAGA